MKKSQLLALIATFGSLAAFAVAADAPATAPAAPAATTAAPAAPAPAFTVTISKAHVCCGSCVKGAAAAVSKLPGVTAIASITDGTIIVGAADKASAQKGVDALVAAGFYGVSSDASIKVNNDTGAKAGAVSSLEVDNLHLCCGKCVQAVNDILAKVPGVTGNDAAVKAASFKITGNFKPTDVFAAFNAAGLTGKAGATVAVAAPAPAASTAAK